jgi:hypothetical protein
LIHGILPTVKLSRPNRDDNGDDNGGEDGGNRSGGDGGDSGCDSGGESYGKSVERTQTALTSLASLAALDQGKEVDNSSSKVVVKLPYSWEAMDVRVVSAKVYLLPFSSPMQRFLLF